MFTYFHIAKDFTSAAGFLHDVEPQHDVQEQQVQSPHEKCVWKNSMAEKINKVVKMQSSQSETAAAADNPTDTYIVESLGEITSKLLLLENRIGSLEQTLLPSNIVCDESQLLF